jgi:hypothetical protein
VTEPAADRQSTYQRRAEKCRRGVARTGYVAAGLGGIGLFGAGDVASQVFQNAGVLRALFFSAVLIAGAALACAYYSFEWEAVRIERSMADGVLVAGEPIPADWGTPVAEHYFRVGLGLVILAGLILLAAAWWSM